MYTYHARLDRVIDGDTFDCLVDLGFHISVKIRVRLDGVDAPERGDRLRWHRAKIETQRLLTDAGEFEIRTRKVPEKYGRWLATVTWGNGMLDLGESLVRYGLASRWDGTGPHPVLPEVTTTTSTTESPE